LPTKTVARCITILGSTGSIGTSTLDVVRALGTDYRIVGLGARTRWRELAEQARQVRPSAIALADDREADALRSLVHGTVVLTGASGLVELASREDSDFVVAAIVGAAGLESTLAAIR